MIGRGVHLPGVLTEHLQPDAGQGEYDQTYLEHSQWRAGRRGQAAGGDGMIVDRGASIRGARGADRAAGQAVAVTQGRDWPKMLFWLLAALLGAAFWAGITLMVVSPPRFQCS